MKSICFFTSDMSWSGGTNKCTSMIANGLASLNKFSIFVVDLHNNENEVLYPLNKNVHYESLDAKEHFDIVKKLRVFIKRNAIDVVINVEGLLGIYSIPATLFTDTRRIIWEHGNYYLKRYNKVDLVRWLEFKLCDYYITLTENDKNEFSRHFKGRCKTKHIYNACETLNKAQMYDPGKKSIITVGMNRPDKGFDMLVEVARLVHSSHPDWTWNIYGTMEVDQNLNKYVMAKIKEYHLESFLRLNGLKKNVLDYYTESSIMVMTSRREGLPMVLLEARGYGIPMIAFDIKTGPNEIIDNNINGYLINTYDVDDMAKRICKLIEDKELRMQFSRGTQLGIEKFDISSVIREWDELLEGI